MEVNDFEEVVLLSPYQIAEGPSNRRLTGEYYLILALGKQCRVRPGFAAYSFADAQGNDLKAYYWYASRWIYPGEPQIVPVPVWAHFWNFSIQFVPTTFPPSPQPHVKIFFKG